MAAGLLWYLCELSCDCVQFQEMLDLALAYNKVGENFPYWWLVFTKQILSAWHSGSGGRENYDS